MLAEDSLLNYTHIKVGEKDSKRGAHCDAIYLGVHLTFMGNEGSLHCTKAEKGTEGVFRYGEGGGAIIPIYSLTYEVNSLVNRHVRE